MKSILKNILVCPNCESSVGYNFSSTRAECPSCNRAFEIIDGKVCFLDMSIKSVIDLSPKEPGTGSYWRKSNWEFNKSFAKSLNHKEIVIEIGCGRGYFKPLFGKNYIGTDIVLNKSVDFVCDLTKENYLRPESVDVFLMNNLLEHIYDYSALLKNCLSSLKKNGKLLITVPWSGALHQVPNDYFRFSHYSLQKLLENNGMSIIQFEAVHSPIIQLRRSLNSLILALIDNQRNKLAKIIFNLIKIMLKIAVYVSNGIYPSGRQSLLDDNLDDSDHDLKNPIGYQIIAIKK